MDLEADDDDMAPLPASSPPRQEALPLPLPLPGVSSVTRPRSRRGGPGTAPKGSQPPQQSAAVSSQVLLLLTLMTPSARVVSGTVIPGEEVVVQAVQCEGVLHPGFDSHNNCNTKHW